MALRALQGTQSETLQGSRSVTLAWCGAATLAGVTLVTAGCASAVATPVASAHDAPVPAAEPRAELGLVLALPPAPDCEERFDLALYREPGVELVAWDEAAGRCDGRHATIRYFPRRLDRDALLGRVRGLAVTAQVVETAPPAPGSRTE